MKTLGLAISAILWSVIFLPNGQYMVVDDGQAGSTTVSQNNGGYRASGSDGSQQVVIPTGNNSVYQAPVYQPPQPTYQQPSNVPDFQVKPYNWGQ